MSNEINDFAELVVSMQKAVKILSTPHANAQRLVWLFEADSLENNDAMGILYHYATSKHPKDGSVLVLFRNNLDGFFLTTSLDLATTESDLMDDDIHSFPLNSSNDSFVRNCYWF